MIVLADTAQNSGDPVLVFGLIAIGYILYCFPLALVFKKAGADTWMAFVPILNLFALLKVVGRPGWWLVLYLIPIVSVIVSILVYYDLARSFGHGAGFTVGLVLLPWIFLAILGFNKDRYRGPAAASPSTA